MWTLKWQNWTLIVNTIFWKGLHALFTILIFLSHWITYFMLLVQLLLLTSLSHCFARICLPCLPLYSVRASPYFYKLSKSNITVYILLHTVYLVFWLFSFTLHFSSLVYDYKRLLWWIKEYILIHFCCVNSIVVFWPFND